MSTSNMPKNFKTFAEQADYLTSSKNITADEDIKRVLKERPYVSLINPYKKRFAESKNERGMSIPRELQLLLVKCAESDGADASGTINEKGGSAARMPPLPEGLALLRQ